MIQANDRLENPVTGEVMIFRRTARDTGGETVLVETMVRPGGFVAAAHLHPRQTERFEVLEGQLGLQIGSARLQAGPGEVATVEPGTPHRFWNAGEDTVRLPFPPAWLQRGALVIADRLGRLLGYQATAVVAAH